MNKSLYHLKLELYRRPAVQRKHPEAHDIFLPTPATDIFTSKLPAHRTTPWTRDFLHKRAKGSISTEHGSPRTPEVRPASGHSDHIGDALLLPERNQALNQAPVHVLASPKPTPKEAGKDWRFGPVTLDSIDMDSKAHGTDGTVTKSSVVAHTKAEYLPSETRTTEIGWGIVHLYKDARENSVATRSASGARAGTNVVDDTFDVDKCSTLCILAVPSWMMPSDLLGFVGEQTREDVSHFRLIRTARANKYMVLMKFRSPKKARDWQSAWNGRLFSAMEPENCHVVFIKSVSFVTPDSDDSSGINFPQNNSHDPFTTGTGVAAPVTATPGSKPYAPPTPALIELPTCPVCLERMDETTGLLTILCQHVFHCACLEKWRGSGCPVCRYTQAPSSTFPYPRPNQANLEGTEPPPPAECSVCAFKANLWVCLICGNTGCGRYDSAHAYAHYEATSHCYAMDIASQHVWDYAGDGYVHRLIQNKDGLFAPSSSSSIPPAATAGQMHLPSRAFTASPHHPNQGFHPEHQDSVPREKMEAMSHEYTLLLSSQLDSQRRYFEEVVERAVDKASAATSRADDAATELSGVTAALATALEHRADLQRDLDALNARVERLASRCERFETLARKGMDGVREEKAINEGLMARIRALEEGVASAKDEVRGRDEQLAELRELNRDLTMFVEGREQIRKMEEDDTLAEGEVDGAVVSVPQPAPSASSKKGKKGKKR